MKTGEQEKGIKLLQCIADGKQILDDGKQILDDGEQVFPQKGMTFWSLIC